jgi:hypothetical protein
MEIFFLKIGIQLLAKLLPISDFKKSVAVIKICSTRENCNRISEQWRNADIYMGMTYFAPKNYSFEYLFAITMAAQPLAWFEGTSLPGEALEIKELISKYKKVQHDFHLGIYFTYW